MRCEAIEGLQREALETPRPQVVVRVDRSGLNDAHPLVRRLYARLERILRPIVDAEERRAGARLVRAGRETAARDAVGLRALNDALRAAFDAPGRAGFARGGAAAGQPPVEEGERRDTVPGPAARAGLCFDDRRCDAVQAVAGATPSRGAARRLAPLRPSARPTRTIRSRSPPTLVSTSSSAAVRYLSPWRAAGRASAVPSARFVSADPGSQLSVFAEAGGHDAELVVLVVRHHASGWVREIARKDEDSHIEAEFEPETGTVTVYEGRREFKALERAARQAGLARSRVREYVPYRMLEVEVAANAVYWWAAERILEHRLPGERPADPAEYAAAVRIEAQMLRHRAHEKLMKAFLDRRCSRARSWSPRAPPTRASSSGSLERR